MPTESKVTQDVTVVVPNQLLIYAATGKESGGHLMDERVTINPKVCHGQACIKGTRMPVHLILRMLANGDTIEELLTEYPSLTREDILACFDYAASLAEEQVTPLEVWSSEA
jgi:uncharacterized protein (DUF433 family)